jgi:hypothetical protein
MAAVIGVFTKLAISVSKFSAKFALVLLQVFWAIPLAVLRPLLGETFTNGIAAIVSPKSIDVSKNNDDQNG